MRGNMPRVGSPKWRATWAEVLTRPSASSSPSAIITANAPDPSIASSVSFSGSGDMRSKFATAGETTVVFTPSSCICARTCSMRSTIAENAAFASASLRSSSDRRTEFSLF